MTLVAIYNQCVTNNNLKQIDRSFSRMHKPRGQKNSLGKTMGCWKHSRSCV